MEYERGRGQAPPLHDSWPTPLSVAPSVLESLSVRRALCVAVFALAALAKETAILTPLVLFAWELLCRLVSKNKKLAKSKKLAGAVCVVHFCSWT